MHALVFATLFTAGIKEDSFAVILPLIAATAWARCRPLWKRRLPDNVVRLQPKPKQVDALEPPVPEGLIRWLVACAALALAVTAAQFYSVYQWSHGAWGPHEWLSSAVTVPRGAELMRGHRWDTPLSALSLLGEIIGQKGGIIGLIASFVRFLLSRPWLSLLIIAPWVATRAGFWISALPLVGIYSVLDEPAKFINYYSAPILGAFWLAVVLYPPRKMPKSRALVWTVSLSWVLGSGGLVFYQSNPFTRQLKQDVRALAGCLLPQERGMVTGPFISLVPSERIATDRVPSGGTLDAVDYYLFSTQIPSYEVGPAASQALLAQLSNDPKWVRVKADCQPAVEGENSAAFLFKRR
jgi:hypothetical protein